MKLFERIGPLVGVFEIPVLSLAIIADLIGGAMAVNENVKLDNLTSLFVVLGLLILNTAAVAVGLEASKRDESKKIEESILKINLFI